MGAPDGGKMVYIASQDTGLYAASIDGSNPVRIASDFEQSLGLEVDISPDGHHIAFMVEKGSNQDRTVDLYVANTDGSDLRLISSQARKWTSPSFAPDSRRIAFVGADNQLYVINEDGKELRLLGRLDDSTSLAIGNGVIPRWSNKGDRLCVAHPGFGFFSMLVFHLDNGNIDTLAWGYNVSDLSWSPEDDRIVYSDAEGIAAVDLYKNEEQTIVSSSGDDLVAPQWSSDGNRILYRIQDQWFGPAQVMNLEMNSTHTLLGSVVKAYWLP
jgi:TolB protein